MEIQINRAEKLELLKACQTGVLDTDKIPELKKMIDLRQPAKLLTREQAKEFMEEIHRSC
jgi:hypothetical protein